MKRQGGWAWLIPYIPYLLGAVVVIAAGSIAIGKYNDWIRAPLKQELATLRDQIDANKKEADRLMAERVAENKKALEGYIEYARKADEKFDAKDAEYRRYRAGSSGVREFTGCGNSGSVAGQTGTSGSPAPEKPADGQRSPDAPREFIVGEVEIATALSWYAYAESCYRFVNGK